MRKWFQAVIDLVVFTTSSINRYFDKIVFQKRGSLVVSLLVSIVICVGLSYQDISTQIFNNTSTSVVLNSVAVQTLVDSEVYDVSGIPSQVNVTLTGDVTDLQVFRKQNTDLKVTADLRKLKAGENIVDLMIANLPSQIQATIDPQVITVQITKKVTRTFSVSAELLTGDNKGVVFDQPSLELNSVKVTGSQAQLDSIRQVKAVVDASGQTESFTTNAQLMAYDARGANVNVTINPPTLKVKVQTKDKTTE